MNIAYVLNSTAPTVGSTKAFMIMLREIMPIGVTPFVVVPDNEGVYHDLHEMNISTLVLNYRPSTYSYCRTVMECLLFLPRMMAKLFVNHRASQQLAAFLKANRIQIVHTNVGVVNIGFLAARRIGIPHVYHIREYGNYLHYFPNRKAFLKQLDSPNVYSICITKDVQRSYHQSGNRRSKVIYDGISNTRTSVPTSQEKLYFLYVGRVEPAKGLDQLLQAYKVYVSKVEHPLPLYVAGLMQNTPYANKQRNYIHKEQLSDCVHLLGVRNDIEDLMIDARAIIISSNKEGFGLCMPEAMFNGCLAIARNTTGTKEQLDNGLELTGHEIALRYTTTEELTEILYEVSSHSIDYYQACVENAFNVVNTLYTPQRNAKEVYRFYVDINNN